MDLKRRRRQKLQEIPLTALHLEKTSRKYLEQLIPFLDSEDRLLQLDGIISILLFFGPVLNMKQVGNLIIQAKIFTMPRTRVIIRNCCRLNFLKEHFVTSDFYNLVGGGSYP